MATSEPVEPIKIGTLVRIRNSGYERARVVESRRALGPNGARIDRVRVRKKPQAAYVEVREDQLEMMPDQNGLTP